MLASQIPTKVALPFANSGTKNVIPTASQIGVTAGAASLQDGFPPLTFTPLASGGVPPAGADFNGIFNLITAFQQWQSAGGSFKYDATFSTAVTGYPKGAILCNSSNDGYWLNLADANTTNPDAVDGSAANWFPVDAYGIAAVAGLTNANVTLLPSQFSKPVITLAGTLTGNVQIIFPTTQQEWLVINNTTGAFTVTCKTAAGTGGIVAQAGGQQTFWGDGTNLNALAGNSALPFVVGNATAGTHALPASQLKSGIASITGTVAASALTVGLNPCVLDFRSATLGTGVPNTRFVPTALSLVVPSGATLGTASATISRLALLAIDNAGTVELAIVNLLGGNNLDETTLISTVAITAGATANNVIYSTTLRSNVPFRVIGYIESTQATAGTWATAPSTLQGAGGNALTAMSSLGYGQTWQNLTGSRALSTNYVNTTGRPIMVIVRSFSSSASTLSTLTIAGIAMNSTTQASATLGVQNVGVVPPGATYSLAMGSGTIQEWNELR